MGFKTRRSQGCCSSRRRSSRRQLQVSLPLEDHRIPQPSRASMWSGMVHTIHHWPHPIAPPCDLHAVLTVPSPGRASHVQSMSTCCCAGAVIDDAADAAHMPPCSASDHHPSRAGRPCSLPARSGRTACGRLSPCGRPSWSRASRAVLLGDGGSAGRLMAIPATCRSWRCGGLDAPERCLSSGPAPALCRQRTSQHVR